MSRLAGSGCIEECMKCRHAGVRGQLGGRVMEEFTIASSLGKASLENRMK